MTTGALALMRMRGRGADCSVWKEVSESRTNRNGFPRKVFTGIWTNKTGAESKDSRSCIV